MHGGRWRMSYSTLPRPRNSFHLFASVTNTPDSLSLVSSLHLSPIPPSNTHFLRHSSPLLSTSLLHPSLPPYYFLPAFTPPLTTFPFSSVLFPFPLLLLHHPPPLPSRSPSIPSPPLSTSFPLPISTSLQPSLPLSTSDSLPIHLPPAPPSLLSPAPSPYLVCHGGHGPGDLGVEVGEPGQEQAGHVVSVGGSAAPGVLSVKDLRHLVDLRGRVGRKAS